MNDDKYIKITFLLIAGFIFALYFNTFTWLISSWTHNPYFSHGFMVPLISGYVVWKKRSTLSSIKKNSSDMGVVLFIIGLIIHGIGWFWTIRFLSAISLITVMAGLIIYIYGINTIKSLAFPILFLFFMVPIPLSTASVNMELFSANISTIIVQTLGISAINVGAKIQTDAGTFLVAAPCSGIKSIISLITLSTIYAYVLKGTIYMKLSLLLATFPIAISMNILRIASILVVADMYGKDAAMVFFHDISSPIFFSISIILLFIIGRCFGSLKLREIS
ncbi:MAG: exosortase/archaeosortase family protein [Methanosarcinales archaeon]|nr:exosortase/archaeosortase family protein [Methanosarcinales archaeon]